MRKTCIIILALVAFGLGAAPEARQFLRGGHGSTTDPLGCVLEDVALSNNTFTSGAGAGTTVGEISVQTTGTCGTPALAISDETNFSLSAATAPANLVTDAASTGGPWPLNITATIAGANGSPKVLPVTVIANVIPPPGGVVTSFNLLNTTGSAVNTVISPVLGLQFKKGDIPSGDWPAFTRNDTSQACVYSHGFKRTWTDGSLKHLSVMVRCPGSIAGSAALQVDVSSGGVQPSASARTTTELSNAGIYVEGVGQINLSGTWTATLSDGIAGAKKWLDGEAGAGWIVDVDFKQSAAAHGQLRERFYTLLTTDGSGNLGGIRFLPRTWQPFYDVDTPSKNWRGFSSLNIKHGVGPTTIEPPWPYLASNFTWTSGNLFSAPTANYYTGQVASAVGSVPVLLSSTGTLPGGLNTNQIYWVWDPSVGSTVTIRPNSDGGAPVTATSAGTGTHTMTPIRTVLHFGSYFGATTEARWQYIQGGGSQASDAPLISQREKVYWHSTKTIPPWDLSVGQVADNATWAYNWDPVTVGKHTLGLQDTSDRGDIGITTEWFMRAFFNQTAANDKLTRAHGLSAAHLGVSALQSTTSTIPNMGGQAYTGLGADVSNSWFWNTAGTAMGFTAPPAANRSMGWASLTWSHMPATAFPAFLSFGTPEFFDLMVETAHGAVGIGTIYNRNPLVPAPGRVGIKTSSGPSGRGAAWEVRDIVAAAGLSPDTSYDGVNYKSYFTDRAIGSLEWMGITTANINSYTNTHGLFVQFDFGSADQGYRPRSPWEMGYLAMSANYGAALLESSAGVTALNDYSRWLGHKITAFGGYNLLKFQEIIGDDANQVVIDNDDIWGGYGCQTSPSWAAGTPGTVTYNGRYPPSNGDKWVFVGDPSQGAVGAMGVVWPANTAGNRITDGGVSYMTPYYLVNCNGLDPGTCNLATTPGGAPISLTTSGTFPACHLVGTVDTGGSATDWQIGQHTQAALLYGGSQWAKANGADQNSGHTNVANDTLPRLQGTGFVPTTSGSMKWYMQPSY